jgi:hypothetical protein
MNDMDRVKVELLNPQQARAVMTETVLPAIKAHLMAGTQLVLEVRGMTRTQSMNAKIHAICGEVASQAKHLGARWDTDSWKRFLVDAWAHETNRNTAKIAPSLDGERIVQLGMQTRDFTKEEGGEFLDWLQAWCATNGISVSHKAG